MTDDESEPSESLARALGQVLAVEREHWQRARELVEAQIEARLAHLRAEEIEHRSKLDVMTRETITSLGAAVTERLALVRDGQQGLPGEHGPEGPAGPVGPPGELGERGEHGKQGEAGPQGPIGLAGPTGLKGDLGDPGEPGATGEKGQPGERGEPGASGAQGPAGEMGPQGVRGLEGPRGMLPIVKAWTPDVVHYAGDVVVHFGSSWQATRDTGQAPPHRDWIPLAMRGIDGLTPQVQGTWSAEAKYHELDIVAVNGGSFIARCDDPGPCPGAGWQSLVQPGARGKAGEQGPPGDRGEKGARGDAGRAGRDGAALVNWQVDRENYTVTPVMADGSGGPTLALRKLFQQFIDDSK